jgi:mannose-6-phosphate isomerase-like protein (cupin superfamily)
MAPSTSNHPTVLSNAEIGVLPMLAFGDIEGVSHRVLWRDGTSTTGVMMIDGGHHLGAHSHRAHHHHFWVIAGEATVLGKRLGVGSYVHVPAGVVHDIDATATDGCTIYYTYLLPSGG